MIKRKIVSLSLLLICLLSFVYIPDSFSTSQISMTFPTGTNNLWEGHLYDFTSNYYNDDFYSQQYTSANLEVQFVESFNGEPHNNYSITSLDTMYNYYPNNLSVSDGIYNGEGTANLLDDDYYNISSTNNHLTYPYESDLNFTDGVMNNYGDMSQSSSNYTIINSTYSESYALQSDLSIEDGTLDSFGSLQYNDDISSEFSSEGVPAIHNATYSFTDDDDDETGTDISWVDVDDSGTNCEARKISDYLGHKDVMRIYDNSDPERVEIQNNFTSGQSVGTVEFWIASTDVSKVTSIYLRDEFETAGTNFKIRESKFQYHDGSYKDIIAIENNKWYHVRFDFNCTTDTYDIYIDDVLRINDASFCNNVNTFVSLFIQTHTTNLGYYTYFDAIGYSWDHSFYTDNFDTADTDNYYRDISSDFESEIIGTEGEDIKFIDDTTIGENCSIEIVDFGDDHGKVLNCSDYSDSVSWELYDYFDTNEESVSTVEFWYYTEGVGDINIIQINYAGSSFVRGYIIHSGANLKFFNRTTEVTVDSITYNEWHHLKIIMNMSTDTYDVYHDFVLVADDFLAYATFDFIEINRLRLCSSGLYSKDYSIYFDAVGYSWDSEYTVGENLIYEDKIPSGWTSNNELDDQLCTVYVNSTIDSNSNVLVLQDAYGSDLAFIERDFNGLIQNGIIEFMFGKQNIKLYSDYSIRFYEDSTEIIRLKVDCDDFKYYNGGYIAIKSNFIVSDSLYHIRLVLNDSAFDCYIDGILEGSNLDYMNSPSNSINNIKLHTQTGGHYDYSCYFDNFTYSTRVNYEIGDNYYKTNSTIDFNCSIDISSLGTEYLTLFYALNNSIFETTSVYLFNFTSLEWVLIKSQDFTISTTNILVLNSSFYNSTNNILLRFYLINNTNYINLSLDQLSIHTYKNIDIIASISLSQFIDLNNLTLVYSFNTSISQLLNFSIYNFTSSSWGVLNSSIFLTMVYQEYSISSDFLNSSYNCLFRFELSNNTYEYSLYIDQFRITELSYLDISAVIECDTNLDLLEFQISSYYHTDISQTLNFSIYCYDNSSWVLINSSINFDDFYELLFIYNSSNILDFFNSSRYIMLRWYAVNYTNTFDFYNDFVQLKVFTPLYLSYELSFNLLGVWRYRWNVIDDSYCSDWVYFDVIPPEPNIKMISESDKLTEWEFLSTDYTEIGLYEVDFSSENWISDLSEVMMVSGMDDDTFADELQPDTVSGLYDYIKNFDLVGTNRECRGYFKFLLPEGYINNDILYSTISYNVWLMDSSGGLYFYVYNTTNFDEDTLTWNNKPALDTALAQLPYQANWNTINLTQFEEFVGIALESPSTLVNSLYFYSKEENTGNKDPYITHYLKRYSNEASYIYLQANQTETLNIKSQNNLNLNLQEGDKIEICFNTTSTNQLNLNLLNSEIEQTSYIISQQDNQNFNNRTTSITIDRNYTIDQIEFEGLFEDTKNLFLNSIRIYRLNATGISETYSVEPQGNEEIYIDFPTELEISVYEDNLLVESFTINSSQDITVLVYEKINTQINYIFLYDSNEEYLNYFDFTVYINYTYQEVESLNKRLSSNQFTTDVETTFDFKVYDSFDGLVKFDSNINVEIFIDIILNVFELKIKNEAQEYVNYTIENIDTSSEKEGLLLPEETKYYYLASNNYSLSYTNHEDDSTSTYTFEFNSNRIIVINSTYFQVYFALFNYDALGLDNELFRFYINNERKDLGFNILTQDTNRLVVRDYFNATLKDTTVNLRQFPEYNLYVEVYTIFILNNFNRTIKIEIERVGTSIIIEQVIGSRMGLEYRFLPNIEYEINAYEQNGTLIESKSILLDSNNKIVDFGFYSTRINYDRFKDTFSNLFYTIMFFFIIILVFVGISFYLKKINDKKRTRIKTQFIKKQKISSDAHRRGYFD